MHKGINPSGLNLPDTNIECANQSMTWNSSEMDVSGEIIEGSHIKLCLVETCEVD